MKLQNTQYVFQTLLDKDLINDIHRTLAILLLFSLIAAFIVIIVKLLLDYRIKTKLIENQVPEHLATPFLRSNQQNTKNEAFKWFTLFLSIGVGFALITLFEPFGIHSIIIMALSIAAGFLGYYYFIKKSK